MTSLEGLSNQPEKSDGERWLELIGSGDLIGTPMPYFIDGRQLMAEEFLSIPECEPHARLLFGYMESMNIDDPRREETIEAAKAMLRHYLNKPAETQG